MLQIYLQKLLIEVVNAARHNLLLLLEVNAARHNLLLLLEVNAARHKLTTAVKTVNREVQLQALVDGKKIIITKAYVRRNIQLNDEEADEVVNEEMNDSLVRAATTAFSLEAEQDSGNIDKTRSKATLNEPSTLGTSSGSGPRRQDTMGDTIAQTRFENVSQTSNDSLLAGVNIPQSDEDRLKLNELMKFCTKLQQRVLD
ncbi:hypothetical protein Tco_1470737, partial [Tanacetum coccineum]